MLLVYDPKLKNHDVTRLVPLFGVPEDFRTADMQNQDVLLVCNLNVFSYPFTRFKSCRRLIYVCSDPEFPLPSELANSINGKPNVCICNSPRPDYKWARVFSEWHQVQLNWASYVEYNVPKDRDWVYWGSKRKGRDFTPVEWMDLSCTPSALRKHDSWKGRYVGYLSMQELARYRGTLYIEDKNQHGRAGLSNRFYESLGAGIACYFHESCEKNAVNELGNDIRQFIGLGKDPVADAVLQRELFACDFQARLRLNLTKVFADISAGPK